jgi:hypothetical protein
MDFETAFTNATREAWHHVGLNEGYVSAETFLALVMDYYADATYGAEHIPGEPDDVGRAVRTRAMELWADDISPNDPNPGESIDLDAPLTDEEMDSLASWTDGAAK